MGIKGFSKWIMKKYPKAFNILNTNKESPIYNHIYIDINYLLHFTLSMQKNLPDFLKKLKYLINYILNLCVPTKSVTFCVDGPSSFAKLLLQKKRRTTNIDLISNTELSPINLTFGTYAMDEIVKVLKDFENYYKSPMSCKPKFYINGPDDLGEGEIKIFSEIDKRDPNYLDNHLIITSDSDIFLLCLSNIKRANIYVNLLKSKINYTFSLKILIKEILISLNYEVPKKVKNINLINLRLEIVFIYLLLGNDYWDKIIGISLDKLLKAYDNWDRNNFEIVKYNLNNTISLNVKSLINFFEYIHKNLVLKYQIEKVVTPEITKKKVKDFFNGIIWCIETYITGNCTDFTYNYSYNKSPSVNEILYYLKTLINEDITYVYEDKELNNNINFYKINKLHEIILLPSSICSNKLNTNNYKLINLHFPELHRIEICKTCNDFKKNIYNNINFKINKSQLLDHIKKNHSYDFNRTELLRFIKIFNELHNK